VAKSPSGEFLVCRNNAWERGGEALNRSDLLLVLHDDEGGRASWSIVDRDAVVLARAEGSFATVAQAARAGQVFVAAASSARYDATPDAIARWRWRAAMSGRLVAVAGEAYATLAAAQTAAQRFRRVMLASVVVVEPESETLGPVTEEDDGHDVVGDSWQVQDEEGTDA
jgi:hypothetical protein